MNQKQYLELLALHLNKLPSDEKVEIISEIEVHFSESLKKGKSEEEIVDRLGPPKRMADSILLEFDIDNMSANNKISDYGKVGLNILAIGFKNLLVFPLAIGIFATIMALYLTLFAFYLSGALLIVSPFIDMVAPALVSTGPLPLWSMSIIGLGLILLTRKGHQLMNVGSTKLFRLFLRSLKSDNLIK